MKALVTVLVLGVLCFLGFHFGTGISLQSNLLITGLIVIFLLGAPLFSVMLGATALGAIFLPRSFDAEFGGALVSTYGNGTKDEATVFADPNDRASQESDIALELRNRDRERKLIKKIDETILKIDADDYGFCESCGAEIGLKRLEARPTATLCIDCKTLEEMRERQVAK